MYPVDSLQGYGKSARYSPSNKLGARPQPYDPQRDRTISSGFPDADNELAMFETPANSLKVAGNTDVRELASSITHQCQYYEPPPLLTIGNQSINQAVKGIAAASVDVTFLNFQPAFRGQANRTKPLIVFYLSRKRCTDRPDIGEEAGLTATPNQKIISLAGAIAGKVREFKRVHVTGIGPDAVTNAVLAIANARVFLGDDRLDLRVAPEFVKVMKREIEMNALRFNIIPEYI